MNKEKPLKRIGVFDSGIGGLTVLRRLRAAFPGLDMVKNPRNLCPKNEVQ